MNCEIRNIPESCQNPNSSATENTEITEKTGIATVFGLHLLCVLCDLCG